MSELEPSNAPFKGINAEIARRPNELERGFGPWLRMLRWQREMDAVLQPWDIRPTHYMLLRLLAWMVDETKDAVPQQALADVTQMGKSSVAYAIHVLAEKGLVDLGINGVDARYGRLFVAADGTRLLRCTADAVDAVMRSSR